MDTRNAVHGSAVQREQQGASLRAKDGELRKLATENKKEEFFNKITPLLGPLRSYIKRRLRIAYLNLQIQTPTLTSGDILDEVMLRAYANYEQQPVELTVEEWLYRITNEVLDKRLHRQSAREARRESLEDLTKSELRTLEEPITADAEGEVMLLEDLDDSEYQQIEVSPPTSDETPEQLLERKERLLQILYALSRVPERDRIVFELFAVEGFSQEQVARILGVPANEIEKIVERVRAEVLEELRSNRQSRSQAQGERRAS